MVVSSRPVSSKVLTRGVLVWTAASYCLLGWIQHGETAVLSEFWIDSDVCSDRDCGVDARLQSLDAAADVNGSSR